MKITEFDLKWVHMAWYELILRLDGALWLTIISKTPLTPRRAIKFKNRPTNFFLESWAIFWGHVGVRKGPEMIVCHRAPSSLNMSPYRAIWTHFRQIFMIFIDLILQTGKAAGIWASCLDPRPIFNDFLKTKKMCNVRTINLAVVSSHIEPYGPISDQIS